MSRIFEKLKQKWGITSNFQFFIINVVFAIAGTSIVVLRPLVFGLLGISPDWPFLLRAFLYLLLVTPLYFTMLNLVALVFGQSGFFWPFTRRILVRMACAVGLRSRYLPCSG